MSEPIPVTVIGGYLGAGKTTLVNQLLRHADGMRLAILVNEFGALPIDEDLIEAQSDDLISIAGGCVCCTFGSDLTAALMDLTLRDPCPDHILIESSGVAMPGAIGANIGLLEAFRLAGIVVLADSDNIRAQAADDYLGDTVLRQLSDADLVIQTKSDLVTPAIAGEIADWLGTQCPGAAVIRADNGQVPRDVVLGLATTAGKGAPAAHADAAFDSAVFAVDGQSDAAQLADALVTGDFGIVRAKGFVTDQTGRSMLVQIVGKRIEIRPFDRPMPAEMVCIGPRGSFDRDRIARLLSP